jgi:MerR family transcriptional regulator, copper efflux regulator
MRLTRTRKLVRAPSHDEPATNLDTVVSGLRYTEPPMDAGNDSSTHGDARTMGHVSALTIHEAAETTGWSPRMLRYIERVGLVEPARSASGYRLYGPAELQRLRTLRELLSEHDIGLSDLAFAARLGHEPGLREAIEAWLAATAERPDDVPAADWLRWEQEKHQRLLAAAHLTATS